MEITGSLIVKCPVCGAMHDISLIDTELVDENGINRGYGTLYYCGIAHEIFQTVDQQNACQKYGLIFR